MTAQIKQRIIGIVVLLFLALVILPWLFGSNQRPKIFKDKAHPIEQDIVMPHIVNVKPNSEITNTVDKVKQEDEAAVPNEEPSYVPPKIKPGPVNNKVVLNSHPVEEETIAKINQIEEKMVTTKKPVLSKPEKKKADNMVVQTPDLAKVKLPEANTVKIARKNNEPAWAIQLGSFSNKENAESLVKQLKTKGYPAYIKVNKDIHGTRTRVFVGPESKRAQAESVVEKINKAFNVHGVIVKSSL